MGRTQPKNSPSFERSFNTGSPLLEGMVVNTCGYILATQASGETTKWYLIDNKVRNMQTGAHEYTVK